MTQFTLLSSALLCLLLPGCTSGPDFLPEGDKSFSELELLLLDGVNDFNLPGVQAGFKLAGMEPVLGSSGTFDFRHEEARINNNHSFRIGSATKMFMAALILQMAEDGRLSIDDSLGKWFPDYSGASMITIRQLLSHTSNIPESLFTDVWILIQSLFNKDKNWDPEIVMDKLWKSAAVEDEAERHFIYSNNNYVLLGIIAEKIYGERLSDILKRKFFIPLGMEHTELLPMSKGSTLNIVPGYDEYIPFGPHILGAEDTSWDSLTFAAGAMASNSRDLIIWMDALFHNELLSRDSMSQMMEWTDSRNNGRDNAMISYGLGLSLYELEDKLLIGHPGGGFGGECFPFWEAETDNLYVVMYNLSRKDNPAGKEILGKIIKLCE